MYIYKVFSHIFLTWDKFINFYNNYLKIYFLIIDIIKL